MISPLKIILWFIFAPSVWLAQIQNNSFELWTNIGTYETPDSWGSLNVVTKTYSLVSASKLTPGNPGSYYLSVRTVSILGKGLVPGRVVSGKIDTTTFKPISGFPLASRPEKLSYSMQYMVSSPLDTAFVSVVLTKWNSLNLKRDTVAFGINRYNGMAHQWFTGNLYLNYMDGGLPDSCCIVISSSGTAALENSYFYIDNLNFSGSVIGIKEDIIQPLNINVFPNPAQEVLSIDINDVSPDENIEVSLINSLSDLVYSSKEALSDFVKVNIGHLARGIYILRVKYNNKTSIKKVVIE